MEIRIGSAEKAEIQEGMIGLFFEDINYAADGGLYAEMLENRSFEFVKATGDARDYQVAYDGGYAWSTYPVGAGAEARCVMGSPLSEENPHYMRLRTAKPGEGIRNKAYEGICLKKGMEYRDCAVLFRTNAQARLLEERMIMEGVPYNVVGGTNFYSRLEIKDILAYLKTVDSGRDDVAVRRIINVPRRGIGNATLEKAEEFARLRGIGLYSAFERVDEIEGLGRAAAKIRSFVELIRKFREARSRMTVAELIQLIIEQIGYEAYLQDYDDDGEDRIANVDELITKAVNYAKTHEEATLQEFLEEVALVADIDNVNDNDNRVLLMTLHSAKGLEFPCVYLAGLEDGLFPGYMAVNSDSIEDLEEERRLAYVGITRAKDELILTSARTRMIRGETQYNPVSRFVREIPPELLESGSAFGRKTADSRAASAFTDRRRDVSQGDSGARAARGSDGVADYRPKAIVRPKVTPKADKPFIAKGIGSLNQLAGISRGAVYKAPEALTYSVGDRVSHMKYGEGKVIKIDREERDYKVTVNFDKAGQKIMYASFAKLKRL